MNTKQLLITILFGVLLIVNAGGNMRGSNNFETGSSLLEEPTADLIEKHRRLKWNAAQKRQFRRDKRREKTNPFRTQREERAERWRKHQQAINRGNDRADPYEPKHGGRNFMRARRNGKNYKKNDIWNPHWWTN